MKPYELTVVLDGSATKAHKKSKLELVEKLISTYKGKITNQQDWGVKDLAYPIDKSLQGAYLYFDVELEPKFVKELSEKLRLDDDIIRYLLVKSDK